MKPLCLTLTLLPYTFAQYKFRNILKQFGSVCILTLSRRGKDHF